MIQLVTSGGSQAVLLAENRRSVNHRYADDEYQAPYVFTEITGHLDPIAILKAISCYEYQSCEHPGWEASEARSFCEALRRRIIRWLPGTPPQPGRSPTPARPSPASTAGRSSRVDPPRYSRPRDRSSRRADLAEPTGGSARS
ncbi:MAG TPA: hypothetical protein VMU94_21490 [Streptosporangiaceae bacterium]|nr:hypothetical protein [Streptosporangiaceae bacterium]